MRKVLNILESCSLAHKQITRDNVYDVTGRPSPTDIETIYEALNMKRYNDAYTLLVEMKNKKSLAMDDIMKDLHKCVMTTKYTEEMKMFLVSRMADIEYRLSQGCNERIQMASLVGAFIEVRSFKTK